MSSEDDLTETEGLLSDTTRLVSEIARNATTIGGLLTTADDIATTVASTTGKPDSASTIGPRDDCEQSDLVWIKVAVLVAILVCLIILICSLCITSFCYFSSLSAQNVLADLNDPRAPQPSVAYGSQVTPPGRQATIANIAKGSVPSPHTFAPSTNAQVNFKRLSITQDTQPQVALASSMQSPNASSFSVHMAPPSPGSFSTGMGMDSPEETVVKKLALDRIEQEEAKRHSDLALLAEKSTSMSQLREQLKAETEAELSASASPQPLAPQELPSPPPPSTQPAARKAERKQSDPAVSSRRKKKASLTKRSKDRSRASDSSGSNKTQAHKNPSFTLDNKTNKLLLGSSVKNAERDASPDKKFSV